MDNKELPLEQIYKDGFRRTKVTVVNPIKRGTSYTVHFPYLLLEKDMIEDVSGTCSCSSPTWDDTGVHVTYNDGTKLEDIPNNTKVLPVDKMIIVYLKDGEPLKITNDRGVEVFNPDKAQIPLTFNVSVVP